MRRNPIRFFVARSCFALLIALLLMMPIAWSQGSQGTLEGTVVDQSGAGVPEAKLSATSDAT